MSDSNFINEVKIELQKAVGGGKTALTEVNALKSRVTALEKSTVVETGKLGDSWYRKWSDGFIEQGGYRNNGDKRLTFLVAFKSTDFSLVANSEIGYTNAVNGVMLLGRSTTGFTNITSDGANAGWYGNSGKFTGSWYACGY